MHSAFRVLIAIFCVYAIVVLIVFLKQKSMIYFPDNSEFCNCSGFSNYQCMEHNGTRFYYKDISTQSVTVFYHGNAGSACDRQVFKPFVETDSTSMIFVEYSGFSNDPQKPSKKLILKDVENIIDFTTKAGYYSVTVIGESLGSGAASYHANKTDVKKIALITPFSSIEDVGKSQFPFLPISLILTENFDNKKWLKDYHNSIIILHGDKDSLIPLDLAKKLYNSLSTSDKKIVVIEGYGHNDLWSSHKFQVKIESFLKSN